MVPSGQGFRKVVGQELKHYFMTNEGSVSSPGTLWEASKATIRGVAKGQLKIQRQAQLQQITSQEAQALRLEQSSALTPDASEVRLLAHIRTELRQLSLDAARLLWLSSVARVYGWGDKNSSILHRLATYPRANRIIPEIIAQDRSLCRSPAEMAHAFASYYHQLYAAKTLTLSRACWGPGTVAFLAWTPLFRRI